MVKPILYGIKMSAPVRAVLLTVRAINLDIDFKEVNPLTEDTRTPEYQDKNPQHTIPMLEDEGKIIWDSHAIITYLIGKYAENDLLYPKELYQRALVDQRLHFDSGVLFIRLSSIFFNIIFKNDIIIPEEKIEDVYEAYDFLEKFLGNNKYLVGDTMTVADFSCISSVSSLCIIVPIDENKYPKLAAWIHRLEELPYYDEANGEGARSLQKIAKIVKKIKT